MSCSLAVAAEDTHLSVLSIQALRPRWRTPTPGRDHYNHALGICYATAGTNLNGWLVYQGHVLAYRRYSTRHVPQEYQARAARVGLWADDFIPPWRWHRGDRLD